MFVANALSWNEEVASTGQPFFLSSSTDLPRDPYYGDQYVGLRFETASIPPRAKILEATVQFRTKYESSDSVKIRISGQVRVLDHSRICELNPDHRYSACGSSEHSAAECVS